MSGYSRWFASVVSVSPFIPPSSLWVHTAKVALTIRPLPANHTDFDPTDPKEFYKRFEVTMQLGNSVWDSPVVTAGEHRVRTFATLEEARAYVDFHADLRRMSDHRN